MKTARVPVQLDRDLYDIVKAYSDVTGVPLSQVMRQAITAFQPELTRRLEILKRSSQ
jgi:hypothetical protein